MGDLFCLTELADVFNCGDDTAAHSYDLDINSLVTIFVYDSFLDWFEKNTIELNDNNGNNDSK